MCSHVGLTVTLGVAEIKHETLVADSSHPVYDAIITVVVYPVPNPERGFVHLIKVGSRLSLSRG